MHYRHFFTDPDGASHWRAVMVALEEKTFAPPAKAIDLSAAEPATFTVFLLLRAGRDKPIHPTPERQTPI
jgi:hypothetical protein